MINDSDRADLLGGIAAHVDVLTDTALRDGLQLLVDHGNAPVQGIQGAFDLNRLPFIDDLAFVHMINAEHTFHQSGLAGAVFAHQGMDSTGAKLKLCVVQRLNAGEGLDNATHFQTIF